MYKFLIRPILFLFDPEAVHHFSFRMLRIIFAIPGLRNLVQMAFTYKHASLEREVFGLKFKNPFGLAAGFDKDAVLAAHWHRLGFGFVEIGTITPRPQAGNPRQRLFRLPADKAVINRMGFNNGGVEAAVKRLSSIDRSGIIIGANIGKNKDTPNAEAVKDYEICFEALFPYVDYFVVNVSSPNTPGLRELQDREPLTRLLLSVQKLNQAQATPKPLLLKIAPDLSNEQLDDIIAVAKEAKLSGLIATNTTISRDGLKTPDSEVQAIGAGGLSGAPVRARAQEVCAYLHQHAPEIPLVGVGGIATGAEGAARLEAGASLIQTYTGFIYEGPACAKRVCRGLARSSNSAI
ncbi:MAG: quinone-dependent dihydroorotate dehydrogenase [Bacteroidia bacterium]